MLPQPLGGAGVAVVSIRGILAPLREVLRAIDDLHDGDGDLTFRSPALPAEFCRQSGPLSGFIGKLRDVIHPVRAGAQTIAPGGPETSAGEADLPARAEQQGSAPEKTGSST